MAVTGKYIRAGKPATKPVRTLQIYVDPTYYNFTSMSAHSVIPSVRDAACWDGNYIIRTGGEDYGAIQTVIKVRQGYQDYHTLSNDLKLPVGLEDHYMVGLGGGKSLVIGGYDSEGNWSRNIYLLDTTALTITLAARMPSNKDFHWACLVDSKVYIFGGTDQKILVYDVETSTCTEVPVQTPAEFEPYKCCGTVFGGKIYLFSGPTGTGTPVNVASYVFDPANNTINRIADRPSYSNSTAMEKMRKFAFSTEDKIILGGGGYYYRLYYYNPKYDIWESGNELPYSSRYGYPDWIAETTDKEVILFNITSFEDYYWTDKTFLGKCDVFILGTGVWTERVGSNLGLRLNDKNTIPGIPWTTTKNKLFVTGGAKPTDYIRIEEDF